MRRVTWAGAPLGGVRAPPRPARPRSSGARADGAGACAGGAPPLPGGEGVYGEAAAAAAQAEAGAAAMAPFPEEVDVFTAPHWRMKQLVGLYCDKVTARGLSLLALAAARAEGRSGPAPRPPGLRRARSPRAARRPPPPPHLPRRCQRRARRPAPSRSPRPARPRPPTCPRGWRRGPAGGGRLPAAARGLPLARPEEAGRLRSRRPAGTPGPPPAAGRPQLFPPPLPRGPRLPRGGFGGSRASLQTPIHPSSEPRARFLAPREASPGCPQLVFSPSFSLA